tara:strand:+ start:260 stop:1159 length:900 start_codon:yes stop_codon:yes gene_type:complete
MSNVLLVDIGGTNIRYAVYDSDSPDIDDVHKTKFEIDAFDEMLKKIIDANNVDQLVISAAGPKIENTISMTNKNFVLNSDVLRKKFNLKKCYLLNDWEAIAHSFDYVSKNIKFIKNGKKFNNQTLFLGPGTGLGAALLIDNRIVVSTEIGNTGNTTQFLKKNFNFEIPENITLEEIISGTGISNLYKFKTGMILTAEEIFRKYLENEQDSLEVINGFIKCLAQTLCDLSLTFLPGNGILLAGSLIRSLYPYIETKEFKENFVGAKKGSHREILDMISIGIITKERTPLYGNLGFYNKFS